MSRLRILSVGLALAAVAAGCAPAGDRILVSAAASLGAAFDDLEEAFEAAEPYDVVLNLGASSTLREQIREGAPADVFAPADPAHLEPLEAAGALAGPARTFARNVMQIAVPAGNPGRVTGPADLARPELLIGMCAVPVPCGDLGHRALAAAGVQPAVDSEEPDVRALLTKLEAGELDAGVVYATDVMAAAGRVEGIALAEAIVAEYRVAVLAEAPNPAGAAAFAGFVLSEAGREILGRHGFLAP